MFWLNILTSVDHRPDSRLAWAHRKTATSMSEAGTGGVMSACVPSTAVNLLANSSKRLRNQCRNEAISSKATSILLSLFSCSHLLWAKISWHSCAEKLAACCWQCHIYSFLLWIHKELVSPGVNILDFKSATKPFLEKAKVKVYIDHVFLFFFFLI